jgi:hypothetical protein
MFKGAVHFWCLQEVDDAGDARSHIANEAMSGSERRGPKAQGCLEAIKRSALFLSLNFLPLRIRSDTI